MFSVIKGFAIDLVRIISAYLLHNPLNMVLMDIKNLKENSCLIYRIIAHLINIDRVLPIISYVRIYMINRTFRHPPIRVAVDMSIYGQMAAKMH